jgi:hypothetical protein
MAADPSPPIDLGPGNTESVGINYASAAVTYPDGTLESFARRSHKGHVSIFRVRSVDHGLRWSEPEVLVNLPVAPWGGPMPLLDADGELHFVIPRVRGEGRNPAVDRFIDLYHIRSTNGRTQFTEPQRIFEGYCGAIQGLFQLESGRIIAPFADWVANRPRTPPTGPSETTCVYSDDGGATWHDSPSRLTAPCYEGYNGGNYGACEPTLIELRDRRVWMLIRTQTGKLYESFSNDGAIWSEAQPSPFYSSNSPAFPIRLEDGRIVVFWNNCVMPPRVDGAGVYGGRDALHAAISADEGATWRGFREVYRDPTRNGTPPRNGDRGTAYPHATLTGDGRVLLVSGQGTERRRRFLIDPDWLLETTATADMTSLDEWHVFKGFGPAAGYWRDRDQGPQLVPHPDDPDAGQVLHIRRPDERDADGASWNFPAAKAGTLTVRLRVEPGFGGAQISLTDRFFNPCDDAGEELATFAVRIDPAGIVTKDAGLSSGNWHTLEFDWDGDECRVLIDDEHVDTLRTEDAPPGGLSYVRFRSLAEVADEVGFYVASVAADVIEKNP